MRFFHTADIHFGVENYGKIDPKTGIHTRLLDFRDSFARVVDQALAENIDLFVFSGDAYKTPNPTPTQQKLLAQQFFRLQAAGIPTAIVVGNHDHPLSFGRAHALDVFSYLPVTGFHVFSKPELKMIKTKSGDVQVVGIPWPMRNHVVAKDLHRLKNNREIAEYLSERIGQVVQDFAGQIDETKPAILAGHLTVTSGVFSGSEKCAVFGTDPVFLPSQLALPQFDYVALGHLHRYQDLNPKGSPSVVYAGSTERVDFGERKEPKGFCNVVIEKDSTGKKNCRHEFTQLPTRPMIQIDVRIEEGKGQTEQILEAINSCDLSDAIVKIVYRLPDGKKDVVDLSAVQRACSQAIYVAGIIPIHKPIERERRAALKVDMDLTTILSRYFESKENLKDRKNVLLEKAFELNNHVEAEENQ